jgi:nicotinate-nucleotide adenylyltransferase
MVELASAGGEGLEASDLELTSNGPSYTSRTLEALTRGRDPLQFFFITGADAFAEIASWRDYPGVLDLSHFVVVSRPGHPTSQLRQRHPDLASRMRRPLADADASRSGTNGTTAVWLVDAVTRDISSSDIRTRRAAGRSIDDLVSPSVAAYVLEHRLYTTATPDSVLQLKNDH